MPKMSPSTSGRLAAYTDAVFAVIITIMALELRAPGSPTFAALLGLWPTMVSYIVSYVFIAIIWINHHYLMTYITSPSLRLVWLNFAHLFFVSLLPFTTAWMARTELAQAPVVAYATLFVVTDGMYNLFEREILRDSSDFAPGEYARTRRRSLFALLLFVIAACLALIASWLGFATICIALALHLRPDASTWGQIRKARARHHRDPPAS